MHSPLSALAIMLAVQPSKYSARFDTMVDSLSLPDETIQFIDSPKVRVLFKGVSAGCAEPSIRKAFSIVYEDIAPVRFAGDIIFNQLTNVAVEASGKAGVALEPVPDSPDLANLREVYDYLDMDSSGGLDKQELLGSPEMVSLIKQLYAVDEEDDAAAVDRFFESVDRDGDGTITFVEWAIASNEEPVLRLADEALSTALRMREQFDDALSKKKRERKGKLFRRSPEERFDSMLEDCLKWETMLNCAEGLTVSATKEECPVGDEDDEKGDGRLLKVLQGSFAGARCQPVVSALRECYLEYSALRLGGDLIFKLLKRVVAQRAVAEV